MKIVKTRKDLFFIAGGGFILAGLVFFLVLTPLIPKLFYGHWAFLLLALIFAFLPSAKKSFGQARQYSIRRWLSLIVLMQVSLFAMHLALFPPSHTALATGLFPWGWIALLSTAFASLAYDRKENAFGCALVSPLIKTSAEKPIGIILDNILKFSQNLTLVITFALMTLLIARLFNFNPSLPFSEPIPLFALLFLILFSFTGFYKRLFTRISSYRPWLLISLFLLCLSGLLAILHGFSASIQFILPLPDFVSELQAYPKDILWAILSSGWWLGFSVLASLFIAKISRGYSRLSLILAILIPPFLLSLLSSLQLTLIPDSLRTLIGIAGFVSCMILFTSKAMLSPFVLNYLPKNGESKYRNPEFLLRKLFQMTLIFLYIYLPLGPILSAAFISISLFPMLIFTLLLGICQCASGSVLASGYKSGK